MGTEQLSIDSDEGSAVESFFQQQALFGRYRLPLTIVFVTGIVWALQPVGLYYALDPSVGGDIQNAVATDWMIQFLVPFFLWILFWLGFVLVVYFYVGARLRAGRLFKLTGWGMAPFALAGAIRSAGRYYAYQGATLPVGVIPGRFPSEWNGYGELVAAHSDDLLIVGTNVGGLIFLVASAYVWVFAVRFSTDIDDWRDAVVTVVVPVVAYAAYVLFRNLG